MYNVEYISSILFYIFQAWAPASWARIDVPPHMEKKVVYYIGGFSATCFPCEGLSASFLSLWVFSSLCGGFFCYFVLYVAAFFVFMGGGLWPCLLYENFCVAHNMRWIF